MDQTETIVAAMGGASLVGVFARELGGAIVAALRRSSGHSNRPPPPDETGERVQEIHEVIAQRDPGTRGYVLLQELRYVRLTLQRIADAVAPEPEHRDRMPTSPGE